MLKSLLYADLERQLRMENRDHRASSVALLKRLPHPRFLPIVILRLSRATYSAGIPALPQAFSYLNIVLFGLEISPKCEIGAGVFLPHTSGTVIGASKIGMNATIFQGVTLGAKEVDMGFDPALRPLLGDHVTIGAGAKVLGGIHLGDNATVGANSVVLRSVPSNCTVAGVPAREIHLAEDILEGSRD